MHTYDNATIKRTATTVRNMSDGEKALFIAMLDTPAKRERTAKRTVKAERDPNAWRSLPASVGQMRRINKRYEAMGLRTFRTLAAFRAVFANAGQASDEWKSIRGF